MKMENQEQPASETQNDLMSRAEQLLRGPLSDDVLRQRYGPTPACFSIRDVVNLFQWGATDEDVMHLSACASCQNWVAKYAERPSAHREAAEGVKSWYQGLAEFFRPAIAPLQPALLYVCNNALAPEDLTQPQEFVIVAGISEHVEAGSLRLDGALMAKDGTVDMRTLGSMSYPVIRFENVKVADGLRKSLKDHVGLINSIRLYGRLSGSENKAFCGRANIRLLGDAAYKDVG